MLQYKVTIKKCQSRDYFQGDLGDLRGDNPADDLEDLPLPQQDHVEPGVPDPEAEVPGDKGIYDQVIIPT